MTGMHCIQPREPTQGILTSEGYGASEWAAVVLTNSLWVCSKVDPRKSARSAARGPINRDSSALHFRFHWEQKAISLVDWAQRPMDANLW